MERIMDDIVFHTPKEGYNLCGIDCFEDFGECLYPVSHHETYKEALEAQKKYPGKSHIYPIKRKEEK